MFKRKRKEFTDQYKTNSNRKREIYYVMDVDNNNFLGIKEEQYLDECYQGYKRKMMFSAYEKDNGTPRNIQIEHKDHRSPKQKEEDRKNGIRHDYAKFQKQEGER